MKYRLELSKRAYAFCDVEIEAESPEAALAEVERMTARGEIEWECRYFEHDNPAQLDGVEEIEQENAGPTT